MLLTSISFLTIDEGSPKLAHSFWNVQVWAILHVEFDELDGVLGVLEAEDTLLDFPGTQVDVVGDGPPS